MSEPITDQEWARCFLSRVHGREIHGGIRVDELAGKLADVRENALSRPVPVSGVQGHAEVPFPRSATATEGARAITASGTEAQ